MTEPAPPADSSAPDKQTDHFAQQANEQPPGLVAEFLEFLIHNKSWWLTPIIVVLLLIGLLAFLSSSSAVAPFIYTVF